MESNRFHLNTFFFFGCAVFIARISSFVSFSFQFILINHFANSLFSMRSPKTHTHTQTKPVFICSPKTQWRAHLHLYVVVTHLKSESTRRSSWAAHIYKYLYTFAFNNARIFAFAKRHQQYIAYCILGAYWVDMPRSIRSLVALRANVASFYVAYRWMLVMRCAGAAREGLANIANRILSGDKECARRGRKLRATYCSTSVKCTTTTISAITTISSARITQIMCSLWWPRHPPKCNSSI